jgi:hypothetical protein
VRSGGERGGDLLGNRLWHPHDARLVGLHRTPLQATDLHRSLDHPSRAAKQIQPTDPERNQLAGTQARIGSKQDERPVSELGHRREPLDLFRVEEMHLLALDLWRLDARGGVTGQPPTLNGRSEDLREHLKRFAGTLWGQTISQEVRPPLLHGKSVDRG